MCLNAYNFLMSCFNFPPLQTMVEHADTLNQQLDAYRGIHMYVMFDYWAVSGVYVKDCLRVSARFKIARPILKLSSLCFICPDSSMPIILTKITNNSHTLPYLCIM